MQLPESRSLFPQPMSSPRIYVTAVILLVLAVLCIVILQPVGFGVFSLTVPLVIAIVIFRRRPIKINSLRVILLVTMISGIIIYVIYRHPLMGEHVLDIRVNDAPLYSSAGVFTFSDAEVRTDIIGEAIQSLRGTTRVYYDVHPLVPVGWRTGDVIPAWVDANSLGEGWETWRGGSRLTEPYFYYAAANAQRDFGFNVAENAPVIKWEARPGEARDTQNRQLVIVFIVSVVMLLFGLVWTESHSGELLGAKAKTRRTPLF